MQTLDVRIINKEKENLLAKMRTLGDRYGLFRENHLSTIRFAKILSSYACERQIKNLLENGAFAKENQRFDPYYQQKSQFATVKILECLKTRLHSNGVDATILTEAPSEIGRYDIVIFQNYPRKVDARGEETVRIEVKASLGLNLEQIDRYLWDSSLLILVRVITGHVAKIQPLALRRYVLFSLRELNAKADRLLSNKLYAIPGTSCLSCLDNNCPHNRSKNERSMGIVTMRDSEFERDLNSFFQNLSYVAERTASLVVEEMKGVIPMQNIHPVSSSAVIG